MINANGRPRETMQGNGTRRSVTMETFGNQEGQPEVALRTIPIVLKNGNRRIIVNCLLDEGSDTTYVDEDVVKVPITPKHFFRLIKSLYGIGKNVAKIFEFG